MSILPPFVRKTTTDIMFVDLPGELNSDELEKSVKLLNESNFPLKPCTTTEAVAILENNISDETLQVIKDLLECLSLLLQFADDYDELMTMLDKSISFIKDDSNKHIIKKFFDSFIHLSNYYSYRRLESYKTRANRYFLSMQHACELRGRFEKDFDYKKYPIEKYDPKILDLIPLVSISFKISDGENREKISFQVEEDELDEIINKLISAQMELKILKSKVKDI